MTYRVCRKRSTTTFKINDQYCKVSLTPLKPWSGDKWLWQVHVAVSKSKRQLNDWYKEKKNKRSNNMKSHLTGKSGIKALTNSATAILKLRWKLEPGDCLYLDCQSCKPDKQFRAYYYWVKNNPDCSIDAEKRRVWWHRPPYLGDPLYEMGQIIPVVPEDPLAPVVGERYFECFRVDFYPGVLEDMLQSMVQTGSQSDQDQSHCTSDSNQSAEIQ